MTNTSTEQRSARGLLTEKGFQAVADTVKGNNPGMAPEMAERITHEALKYVAACAVNTDVRLAPSRVVDEGWHALILHTRMYRKLCENLGGGFIDHFPERPDPSRHDPNVRHRTHVAIESAGYTVDHELWSGPTDGSIVVAADCSHGGESCDNAGCTQSCSNTGPN